MKNFARLFGEKRAGVIHAVANPGDAPSGALHAYFGDLTAQARSLWGSDLAGERPFTGDEYFAQATALPRT